MKTTKLINLIALGYSLDLSNKEQRKTAIQLYLLLK